VVSQNSGIGESLLQLASESLLPIETYVCPLTPTALADSMQSAIQDSRARKLFRLVAREAYPYLSWSNAAHTILREMGLAAESFRPVIEFTRTSRDMVASDLQATMEIVMQPPLRLATSSSHLYNLPLANAQVLEVFPSNRGRRVTLELMPSRSFVRKAATSEQELCKSPLAEVVRQWSILAGRLDSSEAWPKLPSLYPRVYEPSAPPNSGEDITEILMEYIDGGSLDYIESEREAGRLAGLATRRLLEATLAAGVPPISFTSRTFVDDELRVRADRLNGALAPLDQTVSTSFREVLSKCQVFVQSRLEQVTQDPLVRYSAHGDFGLNNVVMTSDPLHDDRIVFIDTRARWKDGLPVWDPVFDLATMYIFAAEIQPVLSAEYNFGPTSPLHGQRGVLLSLIEDAISDSRYVSKANDPQWRIRFEASCAIRLLGSISTQLTAASEKPVERAKRIADLAEAFVNSDKPIQWIAGT
jgi:hypothetical protein